ncbi:unnamed protein product [Chilo suppressalis]|uniref:DNA/RNA non-specific endonuclease domain-containing protein n=1 Tax=Chilo suppressalis TaxID=168631 RepID=A0ABN8AUR3_CHISP|nr:unnamed protein product [Chilo suppressalis]
MRFLIVFASIVLAVLAVPVQWSTMEVINKTTHARLSSGCSFRINGDLGQPQPVYLLENNFLRASGNTGQINLRVDQQIRVSCPGNRNSIRHTNVASPVQTATATCVSNNEVSGAGWLSKNSDFGGLTCSANAAHQAQATGRRCFNNNIVIRVGFTVDDVFHIWYHSCFDEKRLEVLYVWYNQDATNAVSQNNVPRPNFTGGGFFPGVNINSVYTKAQQKKAVAKIVGQYMADRYMTNNQYFAQGHLAAKSDFIFATGQRSTFYLINAAPQWQQFNAGNWKTLEQNLRARIGNAGYTTIIYTGTFGVTQLRDAQGQLRDIFLHQSGNTSQVPVPQFYYKVVYDASRRLGTAFVGINNPYYTAAEVRTLQFCTDRCRNNNAFSWLNWQPDRIDLGYSFCCTIADFRRNITHIPNFNTIDLLT